MNKLIGFIKEFTKKEIPEISRTKKIGRAYFLMDDAVGTVKSKVSITPFSAGLFLGEMNDGKFKPGFPLLDLLSKVSDRKAVVNEKGATMFLFKNNIFEESIRKTTHDTGLVLVENERGEVLGYGEMRETRGQKMIKHILDRSDFLKREMKLD